MDERHETIEEARRGENERVILPCPCFSRCGSGYRVGGGGGGGACSAGDWDWS